MMCPLWFNRPLSIPVMYWINERNRRTDCHGLLRSCEDVSIKSETVESEREWKKKRESDDAWLSSRGVRDSHWAPATFFDNPTNQRRCRFHSRPIRDQNRVKWRRLTTLLQILPVVDEFLIWNMEFNHRCFQDDNNQSWRRRRRRWWRWQWRWRRRGRQCKRVRDNTTRCIDVDDDDDDDDDDVNDRSDYV